MYKKGEKNFKDNTLIQILLEEKRFWGEKDIVP